jgi:Acetokinase family
MRELETSKDPKAKLAVDCFVYRIGLNAGMLAAALQGLDAFVFTAGIGENSVHIRKRIVDQLAWLGVTLDQVENSRRARLISRSDSRIPVYVIPTDEERMIAQHTLSLLMNRSALTTSATRPHFWRSTAPSSSPAASSMSTVAITSSIERDRRALWRRLAVVQGDQLGDAGGARAALDLDHLMIVDAQAVRRNVLRFGDRQTAAKP